MTLFNKAVGASQHEKLFPTVDSAAQAACLHPVVSSNTLGLAR